MSHDIFCHNLQASFVEKPNARVYLATVNVVDAELNKKFSKVVECRGYKATRRVVRWLRSIYR